MKTVLLGLAVSLALLFSGKPLTKTSQLAMSGPIVHTEVTPIHRHVERPNINYLYQKPGLTYSPLNHMYFYRNPQTHIIIIEAQRKYRFPILGRLLRTHIDIHGPEGRGVHVGAGRHTHN